MRGLTYACWLAAVMLASCKKPSGPSPSGPSAPTNPPAVADTRHPVNLITDSITLADIRAAAVSNTDMASGVNTIILNPSNTALARTAVPAVEVNSTNFNDISSQGQDMRSLAVRWLYTYPLSPDNAKPYYDRIVANLLAWVDAGNRVASPVHTPNETAYLGFYEAYSVVRSRMSASDRSKVDAWVRARISAYQPYPSRVNNWETIRLNLLYYFGYILGDAAVLAQTGNAYTTLLNVNLLAGGKSEDLVSRDAFAYHAYNLAFYARILRARALYEGRDAMTELKARKNGIGVSLQDLMDYWRPFLTDPVGNPHLEFVNTNYAPDKTRSDYNKPYDPSSSVYALEELLFAFPETRQYLIAIQPGTARHNRKLSGFLYWPK